ncbi:hypothetical protein SMICM304S_09578 [Streptomyces microflavus]
MIEDDPYTPYLVKFGEEGHGDVGGTWYCQRVEKLADEPEPLAYGRRISWSPSRRSVTEFASFVRKTATAPGRRAVSDC